MGVENLALLVPIRPGAERDLRRAVEALPSGDGSPFAVVPGTHVARLVVLGAMGSASAPKRRLHPALLSLSALVDGPSKEWLRMMCDTLGPTGDGLWAHCAGWPGPGPAATALWLSRFQIRLHMDIVGNPSASVTEVEEALRKRAVLLDLALEARGLPPEELRELYRASVQRMGTVRS